MQKYIQGWFDLLVLRSDALIWGSWLKQTGSRRRASFDETNLAREEARWNRAGDDGCRQLGASRTKMGCTGYLQLTGRLTILPAFLALRLSVCWSFSWCVLQKQTTAVCGALFKEDLRGVHRSGGASAAQTCHLTCQLLSCYNTLTEP